VRFPAEVVLYPIIVVRLSL